MQCPACSGKRHKKLAPTGIYQCLRCQCIHGQCYLGDSYSIVKPFMKDANADNAADRSIPYDFITLGSNGMRRRHGFFDPNDGYITQVG